MQTYCVYLVRLQGNLLSSVKTFETVVYYKYMIIRYLNYSFL